MSQELIEKLKELGVQIEDASLLSIELVDVTVERDRTDVGH